MKLAYYPKGDVTQWFGENPKLYAQFDMDGHNGIDLVRPHGDPLIAVEDATVIGVENNPLGYGKNIRLLSKKKNSKGYYNQWVYGHNHENLVKVGDEVKEGDVIATMGNTGFTVSGSTPYWNVNPFAGTHVHFGLRHVKRDETGFSYPGSDVKIKVVNYKNGYKGSIDPAPYMAETASDLYPMFRQLLTIRGLLNTLKK